MIVLTETRQEASILASALGGCTARHSNFTSKNAALLWMSRCPCQIFSLVEVCGGLTWWECHCTAPSAAPEPKRLARSAARCRSSALIWKSPALSFALSCFCNRFCSLCSSCCEAFCCAARAFCCAFFWPLVSFCSILRTLGGCGGLTDLPFLFPSLYTHALMSCKNQEPPCAHSD